jgi:hypothetical protein
LFFSTSKALSTKNSYPLVKPSMASFTVRFEADEGGHLVQTSRQVEEKHWFHHHDNVSTHTSLVVWQFLTSKNITVIPHPPPSICLTSPPATFSYSPIEIMAERVSFWHEWGDPRRIARGYRHTHIWKLPGMHGIMGNMLGSLYTCPRGLLRRRQWKLGVTLRNFFLWSNSLNFWVAPHTLHTSKD